VARRRRFIHGLHLPCARMRTKFNGIRAEIVKQWEIRASPGLLGAAESMLHSIHVQGFAFFNHVQTTKNRRQISAR